MKASELTATIRARSQLTLPGEAMKALGVSEGDTLVVEIDPQKHTATLRPIRRSYAGALAGVYGDADEYVAGERKAWP